MFLLGGTIIRRIAHSLSAVVVLTATLACPDGLLAAPTITKEGVIRAANAIGFPTFTDDGVAEQGKRERLAKYMRAFENFASTKGGDIVGSDLLRAARLYGKAQVYLHFRDRLYSQSCRKESGVGPNWRRLFLLGLTLTPAEEFVPDSYKGKSLEALVNDRSTWLAREFHTAQNRLVGVALRLAVRELAWKRWELDYVLTGNRSCQSSTKVLERQFGKMNGVLGRACRVFGRMIEIDAGRPAATSVYPRFFNQEERKDFQLHLNNYVRSLNSRLRDVNFSVRDVQDLEIARALASGFDEYQIKYDELATSNLSLFLAGENVRKKIGKKNDIQTASYFRHKGFRWHYHSTSYRSGNGPLDVRAYYEPISERDMRESVKLQIEANTDGIRELVEARDLISAVEKIRNPVKVLKAAELIGRHNPLALGRALANAPSEVDFVCRVQHAVVIQQNLQNALLKSGQVILGIASIVPIAKGIRAGLASAQRGSGAKVWAKTFGKGFVRSASGLTPALLGTALVGIDLAYYHEEKRNNLAMQRIFSATRGKSGLESLRKAHERFEDARFWAIFGSTLGLLDVATVGGAAIKSVKNAVKSIRRGGNPIEASDLAARRIEKAEGVLRSSGCL